MKEAPNVTICEAQASDVPTLARLAGEFGYPTDEAQMRRRFERVVSDRDHRVFVAAAGGVVVGWVHVHLTRWLATDARGEVAGLIVASGARGLGLGRRLMHAAEIWTREQGGATLSLKSNVIRKEAHIFYERLGYAVTKTSLNFSKTL